MPEVFPPASPEDTLLSSYRFDLPPERIAQHPAMRREASRLMLLGRHSGEARAAMFADLLCYLPENCLLVANNSRVVPARLTGTRAGGGQVEMLLLTPLPLVEAEAKPEPGVSNGAWRAEADVLLRPAKKVREGDELAFGPGLGARLISRGDFGRCRVSLCWQGSLRGILEERGKLPLPPYIRRQEGDGAAGVWGDDASRYQTVYAREDKAGSVAAPTAGLHFTPELKEALAASGRGWAEVTLHVGYGTFSPVRSDNICEHAMHAEYVEIDAQTAAAVNAAKAQGRSVVAVGTTSCRVLEGVYAALHRAPEAQNEAGAVHRPGEGALDPYTGWINIFLYPGRPFHLVDGLITNFHLPESSLLMLVSAFAGRQRVLGAYRKAIDSGFRFFSYGDAMLIV